MNRFEENTGLNHKEPKSMNTNNQTNTKKTERKKLKEKLTDLNLPL